MARRPMGSCSTVAWKFVQVLHGHAVEAGDEAAPGDGRGAEDVARIGHVDPRTPAG